MSRLPSVSGARRTLLATATTALLLASAAAIPASAATVLSTTGQVGGIGLVDTAADPGATCARTLPILNAPSSLSSIVLRGPTVAPIVRSAGDGLVTPALVSVDFRVFQQFTAHGEPAGSRLVLSAIHQVLASSLSGTKVPDHTFDARGLPAGRYTAQLGVTYKSPDQSVTYGTRQIGYDFYKTTEPAFLTIGGQLSQRVIGIGSAC
jgi:hypothetical protein